ncbi:MAG: PAS domain-containing protein [Armatimonadetes bacterium]|nr:PAS domain-containing protein [Armatimonadota bacterium]
MPEPGTDMPRGALRPAEELAAELGELRVENERLRAVLRALARTNAELDLDAALQAILDCAGEVFGADHSAVLLSRPGSSERTVRMARGLSERYVEFLTHGVLPLQPVAERGQPFSVRDLVDAPPLPVPESCVEALRAEGIRGVTVLILRQGRQPFGVLVLYFDQPRELSPEELLVAQSFADQCAMAIGKAHEFEAANRLRSEREASEQRLQAILDCLRDLVIVWSPAMEVMVANASAQAMLDAGLEVMRCFLASPEECPVRRVLQTGRPLHGCELSVGERVFEVDCYPLFGPAGHVTAVVQHARDVTENRRLQRALELSEERLRIARDLAPVGFLQLDAGTARVVQANRTMGNYCGRDASELVGRPLAELFSVDEARHLPPLWDEVLRTGRAAHDGMHLLRAIGGAIPVSLTFGSLEFSDGQRYVQCIVKDISARLRLQAQLVEPAAWPTRSAIRSTLSARRSTTSTRSSAATIPKCART